MSKYQYGGVMSKSNTRLISNILLLIIIALSFLTLCLPLFNITKNKGSENLEKTLQGTGVELTESLFKDSESGGSIDDMDYILNIAEETEPRDDENSTFNLKTNTKILQISYFVTLICAGFVIVCLVFRMFKVHVSLIHFIASTAYFLSTIATFVFTILVKNSMTFRIGKTLDPFKLSSGLTPILNYTTVVSLGVGAFVLLGCGLLYAMTYIAFRNAK